MTTQTVASDTDAGEALRPSAVGSVLAEISEDGGPKTHGDFSAVAMLLIDAVLTGDDAGLRELQGWLRGQRARRAGADRTNEAEVRGRLLGLADVSHWAIERVLPLSEVACVERDSQSNQFLQELAVSPGLANLELAARLCVEDTQISRLGKTLREQGLAASRKIGKRNSWELTPKGMRTLELLNGVLKARRLSTESVAAGSGETTLLESVTAAQDLLGEGMSSIAELAELAEAWGGDGPDKFPDVSDVSDVQRQWGETIAATVEAVSQKISAASHAVAEVESGVTGMFA